nr:hypothetical protein [Gammaproteobacteria bacterium]
SNVELIQELFSAYEENCVPYLSTKWEKDIVEFIFDRVSDKTDNLFDFWDMVFEMYSCTYRAQCIIFSGAYQSGKTLLADLLLTPLRYKTININGNRSGSSGNLDQFWMSPCANQRAVLFDEVTAHGFNNLEDKSAFIDGKLEIQINKKYANQFQQKFPPSIVTTNDMHVKDNYPTLEKRAKICKFKPGLTEEMVTITQRIADYSKKEKEMGLMAAIMVGYAGKSGAMIHKKRRRKRHLFFDQEENPSPLSSPQPQNSPVPDLASPILSTPPTIVSSTPFANKQVEDSGIFSLLESISSPPSPTVGDMRTEEELDSENESFSTKKVRFSHEFIQFECDD